jgi:hypothetical protein
MITTSSARSIRTARITTIAIALASAGAALGLTAPAGAATASASDRAIIAVTPEACDGSVMPGERAGVIAIRPGERAGIIAIQPAPSCNG